MHGMRIMARVGTCAAASLLLAAGAQAQSPLRADDARIAACIDRQRPAAERVRHCRALGEAAGADRVEAAARRKDPRFADIVRMIQTP